MDDQARAGVVPGLCAEHGGLMWSNAMRACITSDDVIRGGCRWQPFDGQGRTGEDDPQTAVKVAAYALRDWQRSVPFDQSVPTTIWIDRAEEPAEAVFAALEAAGYRVVHPEAMLPDCPDRWTCCIHERPENP